MSLTTSQGLPWLPGAAQAGPGGATDPNVRAWEQYRENEAGRIIVENRYPGGGAKTPFAATIQVRAAIAAGKAMEERATAYQGQIREGLTDIVGEEGARGLKDYQLMEEALRVNRPATKQFFLAREGLTKGLAKTYQGMARAFGSLNLVLPG